MPTAQTEEAKEQMMPKPPKRQLSDGDIMPFGKYNRMRARMQDVPAGYLDWLDGELSKTARLSEDQQMVADYVKRHRKLIDKELVEKGLV